MEYLHNRSGVLCTILGKKYILASVKEEQILIQFYRNRFLEKNKNEDFIENEMEMMPDPTHCLLDSNFLYFLKIRHIWVNGVPVFYKCFKNCLEINFDAVYMRHFGYLAILVWIGNKPNNAPILRDNDLILTRLFLKLPVLEINMKPQMSLITVSINGDLVKVPFTPDNTYVNGKKIEYSSCTYNFFISNNFLADVCKFIDNSELGYYFYCFCITLDSHFTVESFQPRYVYSKIGDSIIPKIDKANIFYDLYIKIQKNLSNFEVNFRVDGKLHEYTLKNSGKYSFSLEEQETFGHAYIMGTCCILFFMDKNIKTCRLMLWDETHPYGSISNIDVDEEDLNKFFNEHYLSARKSEYPQSLRNKNVGVDKPKREKISSVIEVEPKVETTASLIKDQLKAETAASLIKNENDESVGNFTDCMAYISSFLSSKVCKPLAKEKPSVDCKAESVSKTSQTLNLSDQLTKPDELLPFEFFNSHLFCEGSLYIILNTSVRYILINKNDVIKNRLVNKKTVSVHALKLPTCLTLGSLQIYHLGLVAWQGLKNPIKKEVVSLTNKNILLFSNKIKSNNFLNQLKLKVKKDKVLEDSLKSYCLHSPSETNGDKNKVNKTPQATHLSKSSTPELFEVSGFIVKFKGREGLFQINKNANQLNLGTDNAYCYFRDNVCFITKEGKQLKGSNQLIHLINTYIYLHTNLKALVYKCIPNTYLKKKINFCVSLLWRKTLPKKVKYTYFLPSIDVNDYKDSLPPTTNKIVINKSCDDTSVKKISAKLKGNSDNNEPTNNKKEKLKKWKQEYKIPEPNISSPIVKKSTRENGKHGEILEIEKTYGKIVSLQPNRKTLSFTREKCFLFGVSLYKISLSDILLIGNEVIYFINDIEEIEEVWLGGGPQESPELTYNTILEWCKKFKVSRNVMLQILNECSWVPSSCKPIVKQALVKPIVVLD